MSEKWDGQGMAPAGARVEIRRNDDDWIPATVIGHDDVRTVVRIDSSHEWRYQSAVGGAIRPIRTAEEVAVEAMIKATPLSRIDDVDLTRFAHLYKAIQDGKIPGVKLDDGEG